MLRSWRSRMIEGQGPDVTGSSTQRKGPHEHKLAEASWDPARTAPHFRLRLLSDELLQAKALRHSVESAHAHIANKHNDVCNSQAYVFSGRSPVSCLFVVPGAEQVLLAASARRKFELASCRPPANSSFAAAQHNETYSVCATVAPHVSSPQVPCNDKPLVVTFQMQCRCPF